jgi:cell division protein FtsB
MRNFQKENKLKYIMQSKVFLILLGIIIISFFFSMFNFLDKMQETKRNREIVENKIIELQKSKEKLSAEIDKLKTEEGVEASIREKFGLAKEGENMIVIVEDKNKNDLKAEANSSSFFEFFKSWFK